MADLPTKETPEEITTEVVQKKYIAARERLDEIIKSDNPNQDFQITEKERKLFRKNGEGYKDLKTIAAYHEEVAEQLIDQLRTDERAFDDHSAAATWSRTLLKKIDTGKLSDGDLDYMLPEIERNSYRSHELQPYIQGPTTEKNPFDNGKYHLNGDKNFSFPQGEPSPPPDTPSPLDRTNPSKSKYLETRVPCENASLEDLVSPSPLPNNIGGRGTSRHT